MPHFTFNDGKNNRYFNDESLIVSHYARLDIMSAIDFAKDVAREFGVTCFINNGKIRICYVKPNGTVLFIRESTYWLEYKKGLEIRKQYDELEENN